MLCLSFLICKTVEYNTALILKTEICWWKSGSLKKFVIMDQNI